MTKILTTFFVLVFMSVGVYAKPVKTLSNHLMKGDLQYFLNRICVDGYLFVTTTRGMTAPSITQVFKEKNGRSVPIKCKTN